MYIIYIYIERERERCESPKCGAGAQLHKMGGVKSQPFGNRLANGNGTKMNCKAANALV